MRESLVNILLIQEIEIPWILYAKQIQGVMGDAR